MGGSSNRASQQAQQAEEARLRAIQQTQGRINQVYNAPGRQAEIADAVGANRDLGTRALNEQKALQDRQLKFALARSGLTGGSTSIDQASELGKQYNTGLLQVDQRARQVGADIEAADQDNRGRLIQLATSGLDATSAAQMAASGLRTSLETARNASNVSDIGNVFGGTFADFITRQREAAERQRADRTAGFSLYGNSGGWGG